MIWKVTRDAASLTAAQVVARLAGVVITLYIARSLGPGGFGAVRTAFAFLAVMMFLTELGWDRVVLRAAARNPDDLGTTLSSYFSMRLWLSVAVTVLALGLAPLTPFSPETRELILLGSGMLLFGGVAGVFYLADMARQKFMRVSLLQMFERVVAGIAVIGLLMVQGESRSVMVGVVIAAVVSCFVNGGVLLRGTSVRMRLTVPMKDVRSVVRPGIWFTAAGALGLMFSRVDVLFVSVMKGELETARYGVALAFVGALSGGLASLFLALFPVTARNRTRVFFGRLFFRVFQLTAAAAAVAGLLSWGAPWLVRTLFGPSFADAVPVLRVMVWAFPLGAIYLGCGLLFETTDHQKSNVMAQLILVVVMVVGNLWWIPPYGARGAAVALIAGGVASLLFAVPRSIAILRLLPLQDDTGV